MNRRRSTYVLGCTSPTSRGCAPIHFKEDVVSNGNGNLNKNAWVEQLGQLYARLEQVRRGLEATVASRMATVESLSCLKAEQQGKEQAFLVFAEAAGWLNGSNESARKLAKEKAYAEHSNEAPFGLKDRAEQIDQNEVTLRQLELKAHLLTSELALVQSQVQIALALAQADPTGSIPTLSEAEGGLVSLRPDWIENDVS